MLATTPRTVGSLNIDAVTSAPLRVIKTTRLNAPLAEVFAIIADHGGLSAWFPLIEQVQVDHHNAAVEGGDGTIRSCTLQGGAVLHETIMGYDPPHMYGYSIADGNAFGVQNHLGVVSLAADDAGNTILTWHQYFDHPEADTVAQQVSGMLDAGIEGLIARFGGEPLDTAFPTFA
jgi:uncharacterized protein YndB with AHSA1/START domain